VAKRVPASTVPDRICDPGSIRLDFQPATKDIFSCYFNFLTKKYVIFTIESSSYIIMASITKPTRQAKAIFNLYQAMSEKVQGEVRKMIISGNIESNSSETTDYSGWSEESLKDIWDTPENDHWEDFFKANGYV